MRDVKQRLGKEMRKARDAVGLTQPELAKKLRRYQLGPEYNATRNTVARWEKGETAPKLPARRAVIQILGLPEDFFAELEGVDHRGAQLTQIAELERRVARLESLVDAQVDSGDVQGQ